jgi:hypothetical protein
VLALGLDEAEANSFLPMHVSTVRREHIAACFEPFGAVSPLAGVSPAEVHNRDPRDFPLISEASEGATVAGDGMLATSADGNVVFCQLVPWQFDYSGEKMNVKRTFRRVSCLVARLLGNMQAAGETPILDHITAAGPGKREALACRSLPGFSARVGRPLSLLPLVSWARLVSGRSNFLEVLTFALNLFQGKAAACSRLNAFYCARKPGPTGTQPNCLI